jgi:hypothetical protein
MVTCDGAGASHELVKELDRLASRHGYQVTWSVGWALGTREQAALGKVPESAWEAAIDGKGKVRERRAGDACRNPRCAHPACWIEEARVTELTGLLREGPDGDQLKAWPKGLRVFARRERPQSDQPKPVPARKKGTPGPVEPPATWPDSRATVTPGPKIRDQKPARRTPAAAISTRETSGLVTAA